MTLSVQKYLQIADLTVKTRSGGFSATAQTTDMYASINEAIDNLVKQARRQSKRIKSRKGQKRGNREPEWEGPMTEAPEEEPRSEPRLHREQVSLKPMSVEEARLQVRGSDHGFIVFRNAASQEINVIYRRNDGDIGLIEPR